MPPRKRQMQPAIAPGGSATPLAACGTFSLPDPASCDSLLPLPLDVLRKGVWERLSPYEQRNVREVSKRMHAEASECVRELRIRVLGGPQHSTSLAQQLAAFPLLQDLCYGCMMATKMRRPLPLGKT